MCHEHLYAQSGFKWLYQITPEVCSYSDIGDYNTFGIRLVAPDFDRTIHDVTIDEEQAENLASLFNINQLDPIHFFDAISDFLNG